MKVCHIISGLGDGGAEGVLSRLCLENPKKHIVISLSDSGKYGEILEGNGVKVYYINFRINFNISKCFELYNLIKKINPEVVQTWMYHADFLGGVCARLAGVKKVFWGIRHSNLNVDTIKKSTYFIVKICSILSYFIPKKIVTCSRNAINSHGKEKYNISKFVVIQNGYDLNRFKPFYKDLIFFKKNKKIICMVARYDLQKDHKNLIKAISQLKKERDDFHLVLVGTGMDKSNINLVELIQKYKLLLDEDVSLIGRHNDIPRIMNSIDLHILSSLGEAFPNVLAEAMACGTPCVSTDVGDAKEIIGNYGWVVPPQNSIMLADAISTALDEKDKYPANWMERKKACVDHIHNNFEIKKMIDNFNKLWSAE